MTDEERDRINSFWLDAGRVSGGLCHECVRAAAREYLAKDATGRAYVRRIIRELTALMPEGWEAEE